MRKLAALVAMLLTTLVLGACNAKSNNSVYDPYFDGLFERLPGSGENVWELRSPLVSDINAAFDIQSFFLWTSADLDADGNIVRGQNSVLALTVNDIGTGITTVDDQLFSMRLQVEKDGTISKGFLGTESTSITSLFQRFDKDSFRGGRCFILYRDDNVAIGQIDCEFQTYKIDANFRALTRRK